MSKSIKLKKGFDISLAGSANKTLGPDIYSDTYSVKPTDFPGIIRAKALVNVGDNVKAGTPLFLDKKSDSILYTSPVSGEVVEINRGEKRAILEIKVLADKTNEYEDFGALSTSDIANLSVEDAKEKLLISGLWPQIVQRPYGIVANPEQQPKAIFISGFDTSPLAPDYSMLVQGQENAFQAGVDVLKKFTLGDINIGIQSNGEVTPAFAQVQNATLNKFAGPHPSGNVGVQIHHINPVNKGEVVWTVNPVGVVQIGKLFLEGKYDASKVIALVGSEVTNPQYYKTISGVQVEKLLEGNVSEKLLRVISGNVLSGESIGANGSLGYYDNMVTVIPEGGDGKFLGWLSVNPKVYSYHRALGLFSFLNPKKKYVLDSSTNGEERAFVMTGAFESVTPMDIYPTQLVKAIMAEDYDDMEALGIYEVIEEDLALCEFIDVSKHPIQAIVRDGIDLMINS